MCVNWHDGEWTATPQKIYLTINGFMNKDPVECEDCSELDATPEVPYALVFDSMAVTDEFMECTYRYTFGGTVCGYDAIEVVCRRWTAMSDVRTIYIMLREGSAPGDRIAQDTFDHFPDASWPGVRQLRWCDDFGETSTLEFTTAKADLTGPCTVETQLVCTIWMGN